MQAVDRLQFAPPTTPGLVRSIVLAILAHTLLLAGLTWGVSWHRGEMVTAEAELWSAVPQEAAPPPPEPAPEAKPAPPPPKTSPVVSDADIALAREKQRKIEEQLAQEKLAEQRKLEQEIKAAEDKKKKEKLKALEEAKQAEKRRQEVIKHMSNLAGAGAPTSTGTALRSSGPSASYAGRIRARIKPNIVFTEDIIVNPSAEVEVRTSPDGTIVGRKLLKSSKNIAWDEAVLRAIDKTEVLPRDIDGTMPPVLVITFRPRD
jgi:colicin import membrane protein